MQESTKKIKVAYVIGGLPFGGVESWLFDLAKIAPDFGIYPVVINLSGTGAMLSLYEKEQVDVICLSNTERSLNTHRLDTAAKLRKTFVRIKPDIVHGLHFSGGYFSRLANLDKKLPVLIHVRNVKLEPKKHRIWANKILSYWTDCYLSVSKAVQSECVEKTHNLAGKPSYVLYNAIDAKRFPEKGFTKKDFALEGKVVFAGIGRLVEQKNFDLLIEAYALYRLGGNRDNALLIIGDGPLRGRLEYLVKKYGLENNVKFLGYRVDVPNILNIVDLLVMPSSYEGLPIAHLEAMYMGVPSIISPFVPSKEIAGESCIVCNNDPQEIAKKIKIVVGDRKLYAQMSCQARDIAQNFLIEEHVKELKKNYMRLL